MTSETTTIDIALDMIDVPSDRARDVEPAWVEALAAMIREQGLLQPVVLRQSGARFRLVAGLHRLQAFGVLGRETIPARITDVTSEDEARLIEVMENLGRYELIALDRCRHLWELKQVWERMYPQARHGGNNENRGLEAKRPSWPLGEEGGKTFPTPDETEIFGFAAANAEKVGLSQRAIRRAVKIWEGLYGPLRPRLAGTDLARKQTELKALSELPRPQQIKVLDLILSPDHPDIQNVAGALAHLEHGVTATPLEKRYRALCDGIKALPAANLDQLILENEALVLGALKRLGRI